MADSPDRQPHGSPGWLEESSFAGRMLSSARNVVPLFSTPRPSAPGVSLTSDSSSPDLPNDPSRLSPVSEQKAWSVDGPELTPIPESLHPHPTPTEINPFLNPSFSVASPSAPQGHVAQAPVNPSFSVASPSAPQGHVAQAPVNPSFSVASPSVPQGHVAQTPMNISSSPVNPIPSSSSPSAPQGHVAQSQVNSSSSGSSPDPPTVVAHRQATSPGSVTSSAHPDNSRSAQVGPSHSSVPANSSHPRSNSNFATHRELASFSADISAYIGNIGADMHRWRYDSLVTYDRECINLATDLMVHFPENSFEFSFNISNRVTLDDLLRTLEDHLRYHLRSEFHPRVAMLVLEKHLKQKDLVDRIRRYSPSPSDRLIPSSFNVFGSVLFPIADRYDTASKAFRHVKSFASYTYPSQFFTAVASWLSILDERSLFLLLRDRLPRSGCSSFLRALQAYPRDRFPVSLLDRSDLLLMLWLNEFDPLSVNISPFPRHDLILAASTSHHHRDHCGSSQSSHHPDTNTQFSSYVPNFSNGSIEQSESTSSLTQSCSSDDSQSNPMFRCRCGRMHIKGDECDAEPDEHCSQCKSLPGYYDYSVYIRHSDLACRGLTDTKALLALVSSSPTPSSSPPAVPLHDLSALSLSDPQISSVFGNHPHSLYALLSSSNTTLSFVNLLGPNSSSFRALVDTGNLGFNVMARSAAERTGLTLSPPSADDFYSTPDGSLYHGCGSLRFPVRLEMSKTENLLSFSVFDDYLLPVDIILSRAALGDSFSLVIPIGENAFLTDRSGVKANLLSYLTQSK